MPFVPLPWLGEYVDLGGRDGKAVAAALVSVGLEEEGLVSAGVTGPLVVGQVLSMNPEPQTNGKTINWCSVNVGPEYGVEGGGPRGIVCGAHNFVVGDKVVVALPGAVLPGDFRIAARKTYGHVSDGMMCSARELGISEDHSGIIVLADMGLDPEVGTNALGLLGLADEVVEINITPDRGYCFSIRGVAREFSHASGAEFHDPAAVMVSGRADAAAGFPVKLSDAAPIHGIPGCDRFVARIVRGCDASAASPDWMRTRLTQSGMRPISLAVDVTNYVMLELGQPTHAYDLQKLSGPIVVRRARAGEHCTTLDDVDRVLDPEDLLITDSADGGEGSRVLAIAGVMGGASTEVTETTRDLLIEAAHFDPVSIARSSRRHKLPSEAARRFERGVDTDLQAAAVQRIANLLTEFGGGVVEDVFTDAVCDDRPDAPTIIFDPAQPTRVVGVEYSVDRVRSVLAMIGCAVDEQSETKWLVTVPTWRPDLVRGIDLVEEVARIDGYNRIPSVLPTVKPGGGLTQTQLDRRSVSRALSEFGLTEVLTYPFVGESIFDAFGMAGNDERRRAVRLINPLDQTAPLLRTEVLQTLVLAAQRNLSRSFANVRLFEVGKVFQPAANMPAAGLPSADHRPSDKELAQLAAAVPSQDIHIAGLFAGRWEDDSVLGSARAVDWADAVEAAKRVLVTLHVHPHVRAVDIAPWHPGRAATISTVVAGQDIVFGVAGELSPAVCEVLGLPARCVAFELNVDAVSAASLAIGPVRAQAILSLPAAKEDFAFVVDADVPAQAVADAIRRGIDAGDGTPNSTGWAEDVHVFDVFEGSQLGEGKKSVAVAVRLRADETLSAQQIAGARKRAVKHVEKAVHGELRS